MDLRCQYLGLELANPLVPSASPLSRDLDTARELEDNGASALVMYSLFEEALSSEHERQLRLLHQQDLGHSEASHYLPMGSVQGSELDLYLEHLHNLKQALSIPVIASLNGTSLDGWLENGKLLAEAGADALELNAYMVATDPDLSAIDIEERYIALLRALREVVNVPIVVKLSPYFSSLGHFVRQLEQAGANGIALFNRFYQPDIDVDSLRVSPTIHLSHPSDALLGMRWLGILHGRVNLSLAATSGIHSAEDAIKMILAGADITHQCSALLRHGPRHLKTMLQGISQWLEESPYESLEQARGVLSHSHANHPASYERASYVELLSGYSADRLGWQ